MFAVVLTIDQNIDKSRTLTKMFVSFLLLLQSKSSSFFYFLCNKVHKISILYHSCELHPFSEKPIKGKITKNSSLHSLVSLRSRSVSKSEYSNHFLFSITHFTEHICDAFQSSYSNKKNLITHKSELNQFLSAHSHIIPEFAKKMPPPEFEPSTLSI